jgi:hypothetical protein
VFWHRASDERGGELQVGALQMLVDLGEFAQRVCAPLIQDEGSAEPPALELEEWEHPPSVVPAR